MAMQGRGGGYDSEAGEKRMSTKVNGCKREAERLLESRRSATRMSLPVAMPVPLPWQSRRNATHSTSREREREREERSGGRKRRAIEDVDKRVPVRQ